ncbi:pyridine nucleotide-disulfide oxidoreductase [Teladorsagia circumcincta]|uniref:Pyridine nucleotide-disulfide oxidoreductase n=1 Tax=Teladorsagia circumcincta TaxID=45464 RepID=A0A2G9UUH7_TELCI|nr:pyridine nucleotide-disulfide oxidoreductase [Teladorsagia circumcincta]
MANADTEIDTSPPVTEVLAKASEVPPGVLVENAFLLKISSPLQQIDTAKSVDLGERCSTLKACPYLSLTITALYTLSPACARTMTRWSKVKEQDGSIVLSTTEKQLQNSRRTRMLKFLQPSDDDPIIVVGGGISASTFVEHVRLNGSRTQIIIVTNEGVQPYDRVLLTKRPSSEAKSIRFRNDDFYSDNHIMIMMNTKVGGIDSHRHSIAMSTGKRWRYSKLVLALGVVPKKLNVPGADLKNVYTLRVASDANAIAANAEGKRVRFEEKGVKVLANQTVKWFTGSDAVSGVVLHSGETIPADVVVVAIGSVEDNICYGRPLLYGLPYDRPGWVYG